MTAYLLIEVVLELQTPGGVAAPERHRTTDADSAGTGHLQVPITRTAEDDVYVPASSLAGALRSHLGQNATRLLGPEPTSEDIAASPLWFFGTRVDQDARTVVRTRTAVGRHRASAATTSLRSTEYLETGSRITAYLKLDDISLENDLMEAIQSWQPVIGGGRTTGHGITQVVELRRRLIDLETPHGMAAWLTESGPELFAHDRTEPVELSAPTPTSPARSWRWQIVDGLHIGSGTHEERLDEQRDETTRRASIVRDGQDRPYVPGSTWKGVLRSRCEFILRSLGAQACAPNANPPCGVCLVCVAFGHAGAGDDAPGSPGRLMFRDSHIEDPVIKNMVHVALDRVFGGASTGLLFSQETVTDGTLTLDILTDNHDVTSAIFALLTLACLDLNDGYVGIGGSTTRGLGTLRLVGDAQQLETARDEAISTLTAALSLNIEPTLAQPEEVR